MSRRTVYNRYTDAFKATAVHLAAQSNIRTKDVAEALDIHPFMLSRWKKEWREGRIMAKGKPPPGDEVLQAELKRLRQLEKDHRQLQQEHALVKKGIRNTEWVRWQGRVRHVTCKPEWNVGNPCTRVVS